MLRIKNIIAVIIFTFTLCIVSIVTAQDSSRLAAYEFSTFVISAPKPAYPTRAAVAKAEGDVQVDVKIDPTGKVIKANFVNGHELLKKAVLDVAKKWKFNKSVDNADVRNARLTFSFYLNDDEYEEPPIEEVKYQYRTRIYWQPTVDCFNNCGNINEQ